MTPLAPWLLTLFLCPQGFDQPAYCAPASTTELLITTEAGCNEYALAYIASQAKADLGKHYVHKCWKPGMGTQR